MSLAIAAVRFAAVQALRRAEIPHVAVFDSELGPIEPRGSGPSVVVFTDDMTQTGGGPGADPFANRGTLALTVMAVVMADQPTEDGDGILAIPRTDAGLELVIDIMSRQIKTALFSPTPWADMFRRLCLVVRLVSSTRGSHQQDGARFAGRELRFDIEPVAEPGPGAGVTGVWSALLQLAEQTDAETAAWAQMIRRVFEAEGVDPMGAALAARGLSQADIDAIMAGKIELAPFAATPSP